MSLKHSALQQPYETSEDAIASDPLLRASGVQARAERASSAPPVSVTEAPPPLISIGSPADSALLEPTYAYLSAYCVARFPPRLTDRLNVAIYELLANALRCGSAVDEVRLELYKTSAGARLIISNYASAAHRERLEQQMADVKRDPGVAFSAEMERFSQGSASGRPPRLGLVRVAYESKLDLELCIDGDRVQLSTVCEA